MYLTRHQTANGPRWAADGHYLAPDIKLTSLLHLPREQLVGAVTSVSGDEVSDSPLLAPIDDMQEVWACGVTYLRSREARVSESDTQDVYEKVYDAERVEVFFKAIGWRVRGPRDPIRVRADSAWNVPEPELTLVLNRAGAIVGYTVGNDVSSRDIEGENPLYLPQAKVYEGSCSLGPGIVIADADEQRSLGIALSISRSGKTVFSGESSVTQLKRTLEEMGSWLYRELDFPGGAFLMTGTSLVPPDDFDLSSGDNVRINIGNLTLENVVSA